ncbi:putative eka-like protein [Erysiphe necator]|uniref:Putative eka-like protein n=1 Tax=Uncinula necator TaxID=52586 RepID=A0A0B1P0P5_UNCNE|nr:putative eka-like protein [Erysiphe necator]
MKKARVVSCNNTQASTGNKNASRVFDKDNSSKPVSDKRLFVRLPQDHEWRKLSPAGIREVVVKKLAISPTLIGRIKPVNSGFALSPCSTKARDKIFNAGNGFFLSGAKLEAATNWVSVLIPTVPAFICKEQGVVEVSNTLLTDEVERVCSVRPAHLKLYGRNKAEAPHRTWMAFFSKAPRGSFKVFDESGVARPFKKQQPLEFCKRCNGHHPTKNCSRAPSSMHGRN